MRKTLTLLIACGLILLKTPIYGNDQAFSDCEYDANEGYEKCEPLGYGSSTATSTSISMSMVGWGLGLAIAIAILAGVIHQSAAAHNDSN
ncbi:hypothetical protein [Candidatus Neptunochlamydia vexilliferae]|uniref:Uncharacterized protein n=1 Tax=Candidatus Neptunichlamydia vexilliferae TaxID=1651774 RepID=A0ABS0AZH2_9BACT|nr:hypothetical protein [Candidatus Neptunochlamydia vexilliferae]MBF5059525.1 hypothetical protein [Candidatus Neptunochlamydia vexilliferae]